MNGSAAGQATTPYAALVVVPASGSTVLNLTNASLLDPLNLTITAVRVKAIVVQLLSTTDDATNGTACSSITVSGLNGAGGFIDGTSPKFRVFNGGFHADAVATAGGVTSGLTLTVTNEDGVNAAAVVITVFIATS